MSTPAIASELRVGRSAFDDAKTHGIELLFDHDIKNEKSPPVPKTKKRSCTRRSRG